MSDHRDTEPLPFGAVLPSLTEQLSVGPFIKYHRHMVAIVVMMVFIISTGWYLLWQNLHYAERAVTFGVICATGSFLLIRSTVKPLEERRNNLGLQDVTIRHDRNYLPKLYRHSYLFGKDERSGRDEDIVEFASRPPVIVGFIDQGLPLPLFIIGCWVGLHFPFAEAALHTVQTGNWGVVLPLLILVSSAIFWMAWAMLEYPLRTDRKERLTQEERTDSRKKIIRVMAFSAIVLVALLWWWLRWPLVGWAFGAIWHHPYVIGWLIALPAAVWSASRVEYYLGSYIIVTNLYLRVGSTGYALAGNHRLILKRSETTNANMGQNSRMARLFGYYELLRDTPSSTDRAFNRLRVKQGPEMERALEG